MRCTRPRPRSAPHLGELRLLALALALSLGGCSTDLGPDAGADSPLGASELAVTTADLTPEADTFVKDSEPTADRSTWDYLSAGVRNSETMKTYLRFNLGTATGAITSARLRLYCHDSTYCSQTVSVKRVNDDAWPENLTWGQRPTPGSTLATLTLGGIGWYEVDVTDYVIEQDGGNRKASFDLESANLSARFRSAEASSTPPVLRVTRATCGNGAIDPGEQCDGTPCCTGSCTYKAAGTVCRESVDPSGLCDTAEACTGTAGSCPADAFLADGAACSFGVCSGRVCQGGVKYTPTDDTFVKSTDTSPGTNRGGWNYLAIKNISGEIRTTYLRFDLTTVNYTVSRARLWLYAYDSTASGTATVRQLGDDGWTGAMTWFTRKTPGPVIGTVPINGANWYSIDVTSSVNSQLALNKKASFVIEGGGAAINFRSTESTSDGRPYLELSRAACGNGIPDPGEQCDGEECCTASCTFKSAGSVCRASASECDSTESCTGTAAACPANIFKADGTACTDGTCQGGLCTTVGPPCGNGTLDPGEQCDDGTNNGADGSCCHDDCTAVTNGTVCTSGRCQSAQCVVSCGDGVTGGTEECDDGTGINGTAASCCTSACQLKGDGTVCTGGVCTGNVCHSVCGDGVVSGAEQCDDGNGVNGTTGSCCTTACGFKSVGTACTTGGQGGTCQADGVCRVIGSTCGNGRLEAGEQCDSGSLNGTADSCCTSTCTLKSAGTACTGGTCDSGGTCAATCGDSRVGGAEECDDGTGVNGTSQSCCKLDCTRKNAGAVCSVGGEAGTCTSLGSCRPTGTTRWWQTAGWDRGTRQAAGWWLAGPWSEGVSQYQGNVAYADVSLAANQGDEGVKFDSWLKIAGGDVDAQGNPLPSASAIMSGSWLNFAESTRMQNALGAVPKDGGLLVFAFFSVKRGEPGATQGAIWRRIANGEFDRYYKAAAKRLRYQMETRYGRNPNQLLLRCNKEMNQDGNELNKGESASHGISNRWGPQAARDYRLAMKHITQVMREAYGTDARLKFSFSPARNVRITTPEGSSYRNLIEPGTYDALTLSHHPAKAWNLSDYNSFLRIMKGDPDFYGYDEVFAAAKDLGLPVAADEWEPRHEQANFSPRYGDSYSWTHKYWHEKSVATGVPFAYDVMYAPHVVLKDAPSWMRTAPNSAALRDEWNEGQLNLKTWWKGRPKGPPPTP